MQFVGQLDLAALAPFDPQRLLPEKGLLSFFAGNYDEGAIVHFDDLGALSPRAQPKDAKFSMFPAESGLACPLEIRGATAVPREIEQKVDRDAWFELFEAHFREKNGKEPPHRMLGPTFGDVDGPEEGDHALLAVRSDPNTGVEWGDYGTLYFLLDEASLRARRFDEVVMRSTD